ncbi:MAG: ABC transporter substrate-binding protein [Desulfobacterium sp.]
MKRRMTMRVMLVILMLFSFTFSAAASSKNEMKIATWEDVNTFDPGWMTSGERELTIMSCLYNGLVKYNEGTWDIVPDLAESWEMSEDGKTVVFKLRKGVQFHKGYGEMTAEDVKFSFERIVDPANKCPEKSQWAALDHVEVVDTYTVKLVLKNPMVTLLTSLLPMNTGMIVSKKAVGEMGQEKFGKNPVGTGPYELTSWKPKSHVKLSIFKEYFKEKPAVEILTFLPIVEDATCETALKTGELDIGRSAMITVESFKKDKRFNVYSKPAMKTYWLGMTVNKAPFDNLKLRQAFRYAVNVDNIVEAAFYGTAQRANTILPPGLPDYWADAPAYKQDIAKAKALIKEAGKVDGFTVKLFIPSNDVERIMAEVIKADAAKAGIEVIIELKEIGAFNEAANKGQADAYIQFYTATIDPHYIMQYFAGESWNPSQWRNARYAELIANGLKSISPEERKEIYVDAQKEMDKDAWAIWLTHGTKMFIAQKDVDVGLLYPNGRLAPWMFNFK